jgi:hypothetical protein
LHDGLAANRQFGNIVEAVVYAKQLVLRFTNDQALQKASVFSKSYWLKHFLNKIGYLFSESGKLLVGRWGNLDMAVKRERVSHDNQ